MHIIGITGPIGHGKTTFANALTTIEPGLCHFESSEVISEVANAWHRSLSTPIDPTNLGQINAWIEKLPEIINRQFHRACSFEQLRILDQDLAQNPHQYEKLLIHLENLRNDFALAGQDIAPENKEQYRPILQWLGGYLVRKIDTGIWYREIARRIQAAKSTGCKLCVVGGLRYPADAKILRESGAVIVKIVRPGFMVHDGQDPTENQRDGIVADTTIFNDGTPEELQAVARNLLNDIRKESLQTEYRAAELA